VQRLLPGPVAEVDPYDAYRPADPRAPLLRLNMVASLDGRVVGEGGVSGPLGGPGDRDAFFAMRALADAVVAGAGTVRAEGYGPMRPRARWADRRRADGREGAVPVVVVSASLELDLAAPLFAEAVRPTIVLTAEDAPVDRVDAVVRAGGVVVAAGRGRVDLARGIARLRAEHGLQHLLVEGGPALNGQLVAAGLVDELCLTVAPVLVGGHDLRRTVDGLQAPAGFELTCVHHADGDLLLRYRAVQNSRSSVDSTPRIAS
jgi:riboflavin-specific deaminase-like protein